MKQGIMEETWKTRFICYNCLGPEVQDLKIKLSSGRRVNCLMMEEQVL
jgi:hypothetical protein